LADEGCEQEYQSLLEALWGQGKVHDAANPNAALAKAGLGRDFDYRTAAPDSNVMFLHRRLIDGDVYYLTNRKPRAERLEASFRVTRRKPELWHADSGAREAVSWKAERGRTIIPLDLDGNESVFVVFRESTDRDAEEFPVTQDHLILSIEGDWQLAFEPGRGAPEEPLFTPLGSWTDSAQAGVKYFSGVGTYTKSFVVRLADLEGGRRVILDLGRMHELAEVTLNGRLIGTVWHAPFTLDVTEALRSGDNTLVIRVANLWVNRLIGDKQPGAMPIAFTVTNTYMADAPLRLSGLIGPVTLRTLGS
jgi:hypothetical protein